MNRDKSCCEGRLATLIINVTQILMWTPLFIIWMILVVITGALFFFLLIGAIALRSDEKEQEWLNISIQGLNILFTYAAIANEPIRLRALIRQSRMKGTVGVDYEGNASDKIFDYVHWKDRTAIIIILNLNCIFQFVNQAIRCVYYNAERANDGLKEILLVNFFFFLSFFCAGWAPVYQWRAEQQVRKEGRAPPGEELDPLQRFVGKEHYTYKELWHACWSYAKEKFKCNEEKSQDQTDETKSTSPDHTEMGMVGEDTTLAVQSDTDPEHTLQLDTPDHTSEFHRRKMLGAG